jgi:hypothetical protein
LDADVRWDLNAAESSVQQTDDGGFIVTGWVGFGAPDTGSVYLIKTDQNGQVGVQEAQDPGETPVPVKTFRAVPNPFSSFATIPGRENQLFLVYDLSGAYKGSYHGSRIGDNLAPGIYFLRQNGTSSPARRIVKLR